MKRRYTKLGFLLLVLLTSHFLVLNVAAKRLPVRLFTSADGLGSSFVNFLARDSRGFMWFCTRDGLSRFDGSQFVTYQIGEENSPPGIEAIFEASDGSYWISTTGGTYRFERDQIGIPDRPNRTLNAERIFAHRGVFLEDRNKNLWLAGDELFRIESVHGQFVATPVDLGIRPIPGIGLNVGAIHDAADGSFWISTNMGLIRRLPGGQVVHYPETQTGDSRGAVRTLFDSRGLIWLARSNRLFVINPEPLESIAPDGEVSIRHVTPTETISLTAGQAVPLPSAPGEIFELSNSDFIANRFSKELLQTSDGTVWITCEDHLLEISNGILNVHSSRDGLPSVMAELAEDQVGNLWIAGQSSLARVNRDGLVSFSKEDGTGSDRILGLFQDRRGALGVATTDSTVALFDGMRFTTARFGLPRTSHLWTSRIAFVDSRGDWWILTSEKLYRFAGLSDIYSVDGRKPTQEYDSADGLVSNGMFQIFEDRQGSIWLSTRGTDPALNGVARLKAGDPRFERFEESTGFPSGKSPSSFVESQNGDIWISLHDGGLLRFDGERFHDVGSAVPTIQGTVVTDLHIDSGGRLWITSASAGVFRIDNPSSDARALKQFTTENGLSSNNIRTVTEDLFGRIYIGTARGVDRLTPATGAVRRFSVADGLPADFVSDSRRDTMGNLWFATNGGVARLIPLPDEPPSAPTVWLGALRVAGEPHAIAELGALDAGIGELGYWQNSLQIEFFGINFRPGDTLRYQYKLDGVDDDWSRPDTNRSVTFANLRPGTYRFLVRGVDSSGTFSEAPAVVNFTILPPVWQRWWFLLIAVSVVILALFLFFRYRISNLRRINLALSEAKLAEEQLRMAREERVAELEQVRSRIATDLHDDIGATLTQIAILSEVAQAKAAAGNGASVAEPLARITDVSNELVGAMGDIVWSINPAKDHLGDLTQRMRRVASDLLSPKGVSVHFHSREEDRAMTLKTNVRREVFLIFKESVNNIARHAYATKVEIDLEIRSDLLFLRIHDDGRGFHCGPPSFEDTFSSEGASGNGIRNMRKRAAEMRGRFDIDSAPGRGTTMLLELPLDVAHSNES